MLRGAIIGLGNVALDGHLPGWSAREGVEIVAVTDVQRDRRAEAVTRLPGARWFDTAEALLEQTGLDFVDICTPPSSHAGLIERALTRGLHVLCEKPLVSSPAELDVVSRLAAERARVLHTVHNWHHAPIVRRAAELVRAGAIGPVRRVTWQTMRVRPAATRDPQRRQLAARSGRRGRWHPDRSRLARLLYRPALDRRPSPGAQRPARAAAARDAVGRGHRDGADGVCRRDRRDSPDLGGGRAP